MKLYWRVKKDGKWTWIPARSNKISHVLYDVCTLRVDGSTYLPEYCYPQWGEEEE